MLKKFVILMLLVFTYVLIPPYACAEIVTVEAEDSYTMGGGLEESPAAAREQALERAKVRAAEKAGTYVERYAEVEDHMLTKDKIITLAGSIMEFVEEPHFNTEIVDGQNVTIKITCKIKVTIDTDKINPENILQRDEQLQVISEKDKRIQELEAENQRLKNQFETASDNQKQQIQNEFNENRRQFLIAKYEKDIDIYDFDNQIDFQKIMDTAQKLSDIDPQNSSAFRVTIYGLRESDRLQRVTDYCNEVLNSNSSPELMIEACIQLGDIYFNEYNDKTTAKQYINQGIALAKKRYSKSEIEKFVNGSTAEIKEFRLTGKSNSVRELYILKSDIEEVNPEFDASTTVDCKEGIVIEDRIYNIKYRTDW